MIQKQSLQIQARTIVEKDNSDYSLIYHGNVAGILKKHERYISHYAKSMSKSFDDTQDIKQDLMCETLNLLDWVEIEKIDANFDLKYYIFQKCNAYRKSKKNREHYRSPESLDDGAQMKKGAVMAFQKDDSKLSLLPSRINLEKDYELKHDFPDNVLKTNLDRKIYFSFYVYDFKKKEICKDCKISYNVLQQRLNHIDAELKKYI